MTTAINATTPLQAPLCCSARECSAPQLVVHVIDHEMPFRHVEIVLEDGQSVTTADCGFSDFARHAHRHTLPVVVRTDADGVSLLELRWGHRTVIGISPRTPRLGIKATFDLADIIEQIARQLMTASFIQAGLTGPMPTFDAVAPPVRETFRQAATVAVRKLSVHHRSVAVLEATGHFPDVEIEQVIQTVDQALSQGWV